MWKFFRLLPVGVCIDVYVTICSYVCAFQLINYMLATEENVRIVWVCACFNHFPITWNEFYHNTQPKNLNIRTMYIFQRVFEGKHLPICIMKKINLEVSCKRYRFGYWDSCKGLPNFVNVAARASTFTKFCKRLHEFQKSKGFRLHTITILNFFIVADR